MDYFKPWSTTSGTSYLKTTENMSPEYKDFDKKNAKDSDYPQDVERAICSLAPQPWGTHTWTCAHWTSNIKLQSLFETFSLGVKVGVDSPAHPLQHEQVDPATSHLLRQGIVHPATIQIEAPS